MTSEAKISETRVGTGILRRLLRDKRAVAAVEFAFIAPILLCLYFVTMEVAQGIEANKKVGRIGSMVADLVTQQPTTTADDVDAIMEIGSSILQPYNRSQPEIIVTAIQLGEEDTPKADIEPTVVWSRKLESGAFSEGPEPETEITVPDQLIIPGTFLIRVESRLDYEPVLTWSADQRTGMGLAALANFPISMSETYYLRPRMSKDIGCEDCDDE